MHEQNNPALTQEHEHNFTYADVLKAEEQERTALPIEEAVVVAYEMKPSKDKALAYSEKAEDNRGLNPIKAIKRLNAIANARDMEERADSAAERAELELEMHKEIRWYAPAKQLYGRAAERAEALGDQKLAAELRADFAMSPVEAYERPWRTRHPIADLVERVAGVMASQEPKMKQKFTFSEGNNISGFNLLTRAIEGKGAQGEGDADTELVKKAFAVLGAEDTATMPGKFEEAGHFGLTWNHFKTKSAWKDKFIPKVDFEDPSGRITVRAEYIPESTRSSGEDVAYLPDRVDVTITKHPYKAKH